MGGMRKIESAILMVLGVGMTAIMFVNACGRYTLGSTLLWAEEMVRICFVWAMFIAITDLFDVSGHIGFDVVANKNKITKAVSEIVTNLVLIFLGANLIYFGIKIIYMTGSVPLPATKFPGTVFYIPGVLSGVAWIVIGIRKLLELRKQENGEVK